MNDYWNKKILILGCGNILFNDDGFGPAVIEYLRDNYRIPADVSLIDAGTAVRKILFDIVIGDERPEEIIIVDAIDAGRTAGEIFEVSIDDLPENKIDDFSMHQLPTSNLLKELKESTGVKVIIITCQIKNIPEMVRMGLSGVLVDSIPRACDIIMKRVREQISKKSSL